MKEKQEIRELKRILGQELPGRDFEYLGSGDLGCIFLTDYYLKKAAVKIYQKEIRKGGTILPFQKHKIDLTKIEHPNLMKVYEVMPSGIIISEYYRGENFRNKIFFGRNNSLEENLISYWGLLKGVKYLISQGLAHTDLKLDNILLRSSSVNPKIIDYDTICSINETQLDGKRCFFTTGAGAPEVAGDKITDRTDIFSLGTILYEITQLINPFEVILEELPTKYVKEYIKKYKTKFGLYLETIETKNPPYYDIPLGNNNFIRELITRMRQFDPKDRFSIDKVMDIYDSAMPREIRKKLL